MTGILIASNMRMMYLINWKNGVWNVQQSSFNYSGGGGAIRLMMNDKTTLYNSYATLISAQCAVCPLGRYDLDRNRIAQYFC